MYMYIYTQELMSHPKGGEGAFNYVVTELTITARHLTKSGQNCILSDQKEHFPVKSLCIIYHFRNVSGHFLIVIVSTEVVGKGLIRLRTWLFPMDRRSYAACRT